MHERIFIGHGWFGIGRWDVAVWNYINALNYGLVLNKIDAVEMIVRFLIDAYIASDNLNSAIDLAKEFFSSPAYRPKHETLSHQQMLEGILIGIAYQKKEIEFNNWLKGYKEVSRLKDRSIDINIKQWRIVELLTDVYENKYDKEPLSLLEEAISWIQEKIIL